jgi:hypothetical protein
MRGDSNAQSTAYAVQGLLAAHSGGDAVTRALRYLKRLQRRNGSIRYSTVSSQTPVWVTAQALMALRRKPLPLRPVRRKRRRRHAATSTSGRAAKPARSAAKRSGDDSTAPTYSRRPELTSGTDALPTRRASAGARGSAKDGGGPPVWLVSVAAVAALATAFGVRLLLRRRRMASP